MGFFSLKVTCDVCGKKVGLNRFQLQKTKEWCCNECMAKATNAVSLSENNTLRNIMITTYDAKMIREHLAERAKQNFETRKKCNVCGYIFCYNVDDLKKNKSNANSAMLHSIGGIAGGLGGIAGGVSGNFVAGAANNTGAAVSNASAEAALNRIVDYNKCPHCGSTDLKILSAEEFEEEKKKANAPAQNTTISSADELKKFKELFDSGIITQEEFDAKKKELLGL